MGYASWYGPDFHGKKTASGETYDMNALTAAHRTAPFGTTVHVTNLANNRSSVVRINDRGPFVSGRIIDLSFAAAQELGFVAQGTARVRLKVVGRYNPSIEYYVQAGSFRDPGNARRRLADLSDRFRSPAARIEAVGDLYKVWMGPLSDEAGAAALVERLRAAGYDSLVLRR